MAGKGNTKIFIASSMELSEDRKAFRELIMEQNNAWHEQGAFLQVIGWEHFIDAVSQTRLQDEYNKAIAQCDIFVLLFHSKLGKYSLEEFEFALEQFRSTGKPLIYTYCKPVDAAMPRSAEDRQSLALFEQRLSDIGHFPTRYENLQDLQLKFLQQLHRLAREGVIAFAPPDGAPAPGAAPPALTHITINVHAGRDVIIANGPGSIAASPGAVVIGDGHVGDVNTGTQTIIEHQAHVDTGGGANIGGDVNITGGSFIGRDQKGT